MVNDASGFPFSERDDRADRDPDSDLIEEAKQTLQVLVVDDELCMVDELALALRRHGFQVLTASSVAMALALAERRSDIGAVVCDVRMPALDGHALARFILAQHTGSGATDVVMISGHGTQCDEEAALAAGAFAFLHKPFLAVELRAILGCALAHAAARRRVHQGSGNAVNA